MTKSVMFASIGVVFMIMSMLIMMNAKVALIMSICLWLVFSLLSLFIKHKDKESCNSNSADV